MKIQFRLSLAAGVLLAFFGCSTPQNTNVTTAPATSSPTPDVVAITAEVTRIENDWPRILRERDVTAARRIEADDIVLVYPDGSTGGKDQDLKDIEAGNLSFDSWEISDMNVRVLGADAAVANFRISVTNGKYKTADSGSQDISGHYTALDTFVSRNGQWQIIASSVLKMSPAVEQTLKGTAKPTPITSPTPATKPSPTVKASPQTKPSPATKASPMRRPSPAAARTP